MIKNMKPTSKHEEEIANQYISDNDLDNLVNIFENSNGDYEKFINRINKIDDEDVKSVLQEDII